MGKDLLFTVKQWVARTHLNKYATFASWFAITSSNFSLKKGLLNSQVIQILIQSRSQRPWSFWSAVGIGTSGQMGFWVRKSRTSGYTAQNQGQTPNCHVVGYFNFRLLCLCFSTFQQPIGIGLEIRLARGPDSSSAWQKGPLGTRLILIMSGAWLLFTVFVLQTDLTHVLKIFQNSTPEVHVHCN